MFGFIGLVVIRCGDIGASEANLQDFCIQGRWIFIEFRRENNTKVNIVSKTALDL